MKKIICTLAACACAFAAASFTGCARGEAFVNYTLSEDGTYYVVSGVSGDRYGLTTYEIPNAYAENEGDNPLPVKEIGAGAFQLCGALTKVTIPDTVEIIGEKAFCFSGLVEVTVPDSVTTICNGAFSDCVNLKEITLPESVEKLEEKAFYRCTRLTKAVIKANIEDLEYKTFCNEVISDSGSLYVDTSLKEVYLSASVKKINIYALSGNVLTDIYYAGDKEQWKQVSFYERVTDDKGQEKENVLSDEQREQYLSNITITYSYKF